MALLLIIGLLVSVFVLPIGYTYDETCPKCKGSGNVTCETCHGSGECWICEGTGKIWYMPDDGWCAACNGTGICYTCGGTGWHTCKECFGSGLLVHWMYNLLGSTIVPSIISIFSFLGFFLVGVLGAVFHLSFNQWIYKVENMGFWFNPSFIPWLFAKHRKRWAKWEMGFSLIGAIWLGILLFLSLSMNKITKETFATGALFSIAIVGLFSFIFYKSYISRLGKSP